MKVTVCFGPVSVVVPCGNGDILVRDLISQAVTRYRKASNKTNDAAISVAALCSSNDAILDPDDRLADVVDDREHLTARLSNGGEGDGSRSELDIPSSTIPLVLGPRIGLINMHGDRSSASSNSGSTSPTDIGLHHNNGYGVVGGINSHPATSRNDIEVTGQEAATSLMVDHLHLQVRRGLEPDLNRFSTDAPITTGSSSSSTSHNHHHADLQLTTTSNIIKYKVPPQYPTWNSSTATRDEHNDVTSCAFFFHKNTCYGVGGINSHPATSRNDIETEVIEIVEAPPIPSAEKEVKEKGPSEETLSNMENDSVKTISTPKHVCRAAATPKFKKRMAIQFVSECDQAISEAENHPLRSKRRKDDMLSDPKLSVSPIVRLHKINVASGLAQEVAILEKKRISTSSNEEVTSAKVKPVRRGHGRQPKEIYKSILSTNMDIRMKIIKSDSKKNQVSDKQQQQCGHGQKKESAPPKHYLRGDTVAIPPHLEPELQSEIIEPCQPYTASNVIDHLKVGSTVIFTVITSEKKLEFRGPIILPDSANDEIIIADFNSFAETIVAPPNFRPIIGTIVAALSSSQSNWMRGYITKVLESSYHVYFVDYGNSDYSVVAVKPIPVSYQHKTMSVRLSFFGYLTCASKDFIKKSMVEWKSYQLVITKKKADGSFLAKFIGENVPTCFVKIESWEKTLTETNVSPASVKLAVETTSEPVPMAPGLVRSICNAAITDGDSSNDNLASKDEGYSTMSSDDQLDSSCSSLSLLIASSCSSPAPPTVAPQSTGASVFTVKSSPVRRPRGENKTNDDEEEEDELIDDDDGDVFVNQSGDDEEDKEDQAELIPSLPPSPFSCKFCKRLFKYKRSRDRHEKIHTGNKNPPQLEPEISVEPEQFVEIFVEIITEESSDKLAVETTSEPVPMESEPVPIPPQSLKCVECEYTCQYTSELNRHKGYLHKGEKKFRCDICGRKFVEKNKLKLHLQKKH